MEPQDVIKLLEQVGEMLTPAASRVWEIYVRYSVTTGTVQVVLGLIALILGLPCLLSGHRAAQVEHSQGDDPGLGRILLGIVLLGVCLFFLPSGITILLNPEYMAIRSILGSLK